MSMTITKTDIFYDVNIMKDGKNMYDGLIEIAKDEEGKELFKSIIEDSRKFQLSPDKRFLFNVSKPTESILMYNEDNEIITTPFGWFKKK